MILILFFNDFNFTELIGFFNIKISIKISIIFLYEKFLNILRKRDSANKFFS
jgi:hypothetical protein